MLVKCKECGKEISSNATVCPNCGYKNINNQEKASFGILVICFLIPIVGIILFAINISSKPKYAKQCIISSIISPIIVIVITAICFFFTKYTNNGGGLSGIVATTKKYDDTTIQEEITTNKKPKVGMATVEVLGIWGLPTKEEEGKWIYDDKGIIYFNEDGEVTSIQEEE